MKIKYSYTAPDLEVITVISADIISTSIGDAPFAGEDDELDITVGGI